MTVRLLIVLNFVNVLVLSDAFNCDIEPRNSEGRIKKEILCDYDKDSPPASLDTYKENNVIIELQPSVINVYSYSASFFLTTKTVLHYTDERLMWEPSDFGDKESILIDSTDIWIPNISQFSENEDDDISNVKCSDSKCHLLAAGHVTCTLPCDYIGTCALDYSNWPYAFGNCSVSLGSTDENHQGVAFSPMQSRRVDLIATDMEHELISARWGLVNENKNDKIKRHIKFIYGIIRHAAAEIAEIMPPLIINSFVNILVLFFDVRKAERIVLSIMCMILQVYITGFLAYDMSEYIDEGIPKIGHFMGKTTLLSATTIFESILMRSMMAFTYEIPYWMKLFLSQVTKNPLAEILFVKSYIVAEPSKKSESNGVHPGTIEMQKNSTNWEIFAKIIDRCYTIVVIGIYVIIWYKYGPSSKTTERFRSANGNLLK